MNLPKGSSERDNAKNLASCDFHVSTENTEDTDSQKPALFSPSVFSVFSV